MNDLTQGFYILFHFLKCLNLRDVIGVTGLLPVPDFPCKIAQALKGWRTFLLHTSRKSRRYSEKNNSVLKK